MSTYIAKAPVKYSNISIAEQFHLLCVVAFFVPGNVNIYLLFVQLNILFDKWAWFIYCMGYELYNNHTAREVLNEHLIQKPYQRAIIILRCSPTIYCIHKSQQYNSSVLRILLICLKCVNRTSTLLHKYEYSCCLVLSYLSDLLYRMFILHGI